MFVCARAYRLDLISRRTYLITLASTVVCFFVAPFVSQKVLDLIYTFDNSRKEAATSTATAAASGASSPSPGARLRAVIMGPIPPGSLKRKSATRPAPQRGASRMAKRKL